MNAPSTEIPCMNSSSRSATEKLLDAAFRSIPGARYIHLWWPVNFSAIWISSLENFFSGPRLIILFISYSLRYLTDRLIRILSNMIFYSWFLWIRTPCVLSCNFALTKETCMAHFDWGHQTRFRAWTDLAKNVILSKLSINFSQGKSSWTRPQFLSSIFARGLFESRLSNWIQNVFHSPTWSKPLKKAWLWK
jgi:hypothetical protein